MPPERKCLFRGPVPVVGRDDKGFWTVTTDAAVTPWQIEDGSGNPVEATGDEQVELFRSVKAGNGRVEIALTDGGTLSAAQVNDLSVAGTANCYVVSAPGTYVFNAGTRKRSRRRGRIRAGDRDGGRHDGRLAVDRLRRTRFGSRPRHDLRRYFPHGRRRQGQRAGSP